mmetsp:Transcript_62038/g.146938  ORF Transcript_62038/g.146938 Transcript_62038/m.146938 type:complete len:224 (+) Transcript_62038:840-1511(+)
MGREGEHPGRIGGRGGDEARPVGMAAHLGVLVVVEAGTLQQPVLHREAQGLDQVQGAAGVGREPDHIAGVGRDLRMDEDDLEHGHDCPRRPARPPGVSRPRVRACGRSPRPARASCRPGAAHGRFRTASRRWSSHRPAGRRCCLAAARRAAGRPRTRRAHWPCDRRASGRPGRCCDARAAAVRHRSAARAAAPAPWRAHGPGCSRARAAARRTRAPAAASRAR